MRDYCGTISTELKLLCQPLLRQLTKEVKL